MKKTILITLFFTSIFSIAQQKSINDFKYIIVPSEYNWLSSPDQYKVNSLTEFLFNKNGFKAFLDTKKFPDDLAKNRCLALQALVKNNSGLLTTKNSIELRDCNNKLIFSSLEGKSKKKEYQQAFHEAIRIAFTSIQALHYKYNNSSEEVAAKEEPKNQSNKQQPTITNPIEVKVPKDSGLSILYAQEIENGYQLVNTKPEVVLQILKSSKKDFYFIKNKSGVLFKKGDNWIAEFYENDILIQKQYQIKF